MVCVDEDRRLADRDAGPGAGRSSHVDKGSIPVPSEEEVRLRAGSEQVHLSVIVIVA